MRLSLIPLVAALAAAVCLVIAFMAAGLDLLSDLFMLLAVAALVFIAWTALRRARDRNIGRRQAGSIQPGP
ncbi:MULTISPECIES: hypothetical protein [unclassified Brevundimonas]|uniref:hypothetical protein n=1 Tax=unclassified Brevundimonas TaxID=2622653 RepID=UPI003F903B7B